LRPRGAGVGRPKKKQKQCFGIEDFVFLFFTAASCGLCQGCDLCHPVECDPKEANAIEKDGMIYKQIGLEFKLTFVSEICEFIRMSCGLKTYTKTTTMFDPGNGRMKITLYNDDGGILANIQALKPACFAWGQYDCDLPLMLKNFGGSFPVHHLDGNKNNNIVSNGRIIPFKEHVAETKQTDQQKIKCIRNRSANIQASKIFSVILGEYNRVRFPNGVTNV